jgi:putative ABC transport system substrate-binding protein
MRRRDFITLLGGAAAWPMAARAQQSGVPAIGFLSTVPADSSVSVERFRGFRQALSEAGYIEGRNYAIDYRWDQVDRLPGLAADLVRRSVAVIVVIGVPATLAAKAATQTIPIVFTTAADPVAAGLVASLNRPGGNLTGVTNLDSELGSKQLELLHEIIPTASKIGLLVNLNSPVIAQADIRNARSAASRFGFEIVVVNGGSENEIEQAFAAAVQQGAAALEVGNDILFNSRREQIAALALRHALPTMATADAARTTGKLIGSGVLIGYSAQGIDVYRQSGVYVARILKGAKPADLPVLQPTKFELVINLKTAKALGLTVPDTLLALADEVIE